VYHFCLLHTRQSLENLLVSSAEGTYSLMWVPRGETWGGVQKNLYSNQPVLKTYDTICEEDNTQGALFYGSSLSVSYLPAPPVRMIS